MRSFLGDESSDRSGCGWYALGFGHGGLQSTIRGPKRLIWSYPTSEIIWRDPENGPNGTTSHNVLRVHDAHMRMLDAQSEYSLSANKSVELRYG